MKKLLLSVCLIFVLTASAWSEPLHLVTFDYYPTMYRDGDELKGGAVDIVKEAFRRMGQDITMEMVPMKRGQYMLQTGQVDGMFTLYKTPERREYAYYPESPVLSRIISFYVRHDSPIAFDGDLTSMLHYPIGVVLGYSYGAELDAYIEKDSFAQIDAAPYLENTVKKLVEGRFDILPHTKLDMVPLLRKMNYEEKVKELSPSIVELPVYLAFTKKKGELVPIADTFSKTIKEMIQDKTHEQLLYHGSP